MHWVANFDNGKGPSRVNHASVAIGHYIYSFGGYSKSPVLDSLKTRTPIDVNVLNTKKFEWHKRPAPPANSEQWHSTPYFRYGHSCCVYRGVIYLWGGRADWQDSFCNNVFAYTPQTHTWTRLAATGQIPDGHDGHSASVVNDCMYIFGGYAQRENRFSNSIYAFHFPTLTWSHVIPRTEERLTPYWRDFHTACAHGSKILVFGGRMDVGRETFTGQSFYSNDVFAFDTTTRCWEELKPNTDPLDAAMVALIHDHQDGLSALDANGEPGEQLERKAEYQEYLRKKEMLQPEPCGRRSHTATVFKNKIIVFGGFRETENEHYNDIFEFNIDTNSWRKISGILGTAPSERRRSGTCLIDGKIFIFGGTGPKSAATISSVQQTEPVSSPNQSGAVMSQISAALADHSGVSMIMGNSSAATAFAEAVGRVFVDFLQANASSNNSNLRLAPIGAEYDDDNEQDEQLVVIEDDNDDDEEEELDEDYDSDEDEDDDTLIEFSDLHVLELEVPTLRSLCIINVKEMPKQTYQHLPKSLIADINLLLK